MSSDDASFFKILLFWSEVDWNSVPDADQVAKNFKVSHFDCGAMTENSLYVLNQLQKCHILPEELKIEVKQKSYSTPGLSERNWTQRNAGCNTLRGRIVGVKAIAVVTT